MAKPTSPSSQAIAQSDRIRFLEPDVCAGSIWARNEVMTVNDENRADAELAVKRKTAQWVTDANATGNTANA
ncbi:MAG: hypothetical protein WAU96_01190 [Anaerolineae bacterium]